MHQLLALLRWTLIAFISTCITLPIGYALASLLSVVISVPLWFISLNSAAGGVFIASGIAGALVGRVISQAQQSVFGEQQALKRKWRTVSVWIWSIAGCLCATAFVPIAGGDVAPLVPFLLVAGTLNSTILWFLLVKYRIPAAKWWGAFGMLSTISGTLVAILFLGSLNGRAPNELFGGLDFTYTSLEQVKATRLIELHGRLLLFVETKTTAKIRQWELWSSDGTSQGTIHLKTGYTGWNEGRIYRIALIDNTLHFQAEGSEEPNKGSPALRTWITDGTPAGSRSLSEAEKWQDGPEPYASRLGTDEPQLTLGSKTYFVVQKTKRGIELRCRDADSGQEILLKSFP